MKATKTTTEQTVDVDVKLPPNTHERMYPQWRYSKAYFEISYKDWFEEQMIKAIELKIWLDSPKQIVAGTDGTIRLEVI